MIKKVLVLAAALAVMAGCAHVNDGFGREEVDDILRHINKPALSPQWAYWPEMTDANGNAYQISMICVSTGPVCQGGLILWRFDPTEPIP